MQKEEAIERLKKHKETTENLLGILQGNEDEIQQWSEDTETLIGYVFVESKKEHIDKFRALKNDNDVEVALKFNSGSDVTEDDQCRYNKLVVERAIKLMDSFINEIEEYWKK